MSIPYLWGRARTKIQQLRRRTVFLLLLAAAAAAGCDEQASIPAPVETVPLSPPLPALPGTPTSHQLAWQQGERYLFIHFGLNTFTGEDWGRGDEASALFNPTTVDAGQWARVASQAGFQGIVFTAKHHEGFALWPTAFSDFSVKQSPWMGGTGDAVRLVADACRRHGLKFGVYLSLWDRHEATYGTPAYDDFYVGQLTELLTRYGPVFEVWLDGAHEKGVTATYDLARYYATVRRLQPEALLAVGGPDVRWVGNEDGRAPETQWSTVDDTDWWYPVECDVPNRPHWFWRASDVHRLKSLDAHLSMYFECVGRNGVLLLNVPPGRDGRLPEEDVARLLAFDDALRTIFDTNLAEDGRASASNSRESKSGWAAQNAIDGNASTFWATDDGVTTGVLEVDLGRAVRFNTIALQEPIQYGQRVASYRVEAQIRGGWHVLSRGTTIGHKKLDQTATVTASTVRLVIEDARAAPAIQEFALYRDPF